MLMEEMSGKLRSCLELMEVICQTPQYTNILSLHMGKNWIPVIWNLETSFLPSVWEGTLVIRLMAGY